MPEVMKYTQNAGKIQPRIVYLTELSFRIEGETGFQTSKSKEIYYHETTLTKILK